MIAERIPQLNSLTREEKLQLAAELWESAEAPESSALMTDELIQALNGLVEFNNANSEAFSTTEQVMSRIKRTSNA